MKLNIERLKKQVIRAINTAPVTVDIYRNGYNDFNEPVDNVNVGKITGFYYEEGSTNVKLADKAQVKSPLTKHLLVVYGDESLSIKEGDFFYLHDTKFYIKDLGNYNKLNIYFNMLLQEEGV